MRCKKNVQWYMTATILGVSLIVACGSPESYMPTEVSSIRQKVDTPQTYNPDWAVKYALENYNRVYGAGPNDTPFPSYPPREITLPDGSKVWVGGNCTNFVSRAIIAGLVKDSNAGKVFGRIGDFDIDATGGLYQWYMLPDGRHGPAFTGADKLYEYAVYNTARNKGLHFSYVTHDTLTTFMDYTKVQKGDIIFMDIRADGSVDHAMIVTDTDWFRLGYNEIQVTYQTPELANQRLGKINEKYGHRAVFYVYRPTDYNPDGR